MGGYPGPSEPQSRGGCRVNLQPKPSLQARTLDGMNQTLVVIPPCQLMEAKMQVGCTFHCLVPPSSVLFVVTHPDSFSDILNSPTPHFKPYFCTGFDSGSGRYGYSLISFQWALLEAPFNYLDQAGTVHAHIFPCNVLSFLSRVFTWRLLICVQLVRVNRPSADRRCCKVQRKMVLLDKVK